MTQKMEKAPKHRGPYVPTIDGDVCGVRKAERCRYRHGKQKKRVQQAMRSYTCTRSRDLKKELHVNPILWIAISELPILIHQVTFLFVYCDCDPLALYC